MKKILTIALLLILSLNLPAQTWRSVLYPLGWRPSYTDTLGRFIHDFSYAGYHKGEKEIPFINSYIIDVTKAPYLTDNTGATDATTAIQNALDDAGKAGGGVVYMPAGTYMISVGASAGLWIKYSNVVLRGAGKDKTFLFNNSTNIRQKSVLLIKPETGGDWYQPEGIAEILGEDLHTRDTLVSVNDASKYNIGDHIALLSTVTSDFSLEDNMGTNWNSSLIGVAFYRIIKSIDQSNNTLLLDVPIRYDLKVRDNARIQKVNTRLEECGFEYFSIGGRQNTTAGWADLDYNKSGTGAYEVHGSQLITVQYSENCWVRNVSTYKPSVNTGNYHLVSNALLLEKSRFITVDSVYLGFPQYEGEGGNGYLFALRSNDCLIKNCIAEHGRHNYNFKSMCCSGNVILRCTGKTPRLASDFHMHLSMANLFDNYTADGDMLEGAYRPFGTILHGQTTTQTVFWNTTGLKGYNGGSILIKSQQFGWGYVIGTQGKVTGVSTPGGNGTEPVDFKEGIGKGTDLQPASLYEDQLRQRLHGYDPATLLKSYLNSKKTIQAYPNPASEKITFASAANITKVEIFNVLGMKVMDIASNDNSVEISSLDSGQYILKCLAGEENIGHTFIIKK